MDLSISALMQLQKELYEHHKDRWNPREPEFGRDHILYMIEEIGEVIAILKKKGNGEVVENEAVRTAFLEEMADVLMYYVDVLLCYHVTAEEISEAFQKKAQRNMGRDYAGEYARKYSDEVYLTPMTNALYHQYCQEYQHDPELFMDMENFKPYVYDFAQAEAYMQRKREKKQIVFAIMRQGLPIGEVLLKEIDYAKKVCTLGICLQNDSVKGKGYGTRAEQLVLDFAFQQLGMETVYADAILKNTRSQHVLEKVGFEQIGEDEQFKYYQCNKGDIAYCGK